jgi:hypothetical protein
MRHISSREPVSIRHPGGYSYSRATQNPPRLIARAVNVPAGGRARLEGARSHVEVLLELNLADETLASVQGAAAVAGAEQTTAQDELRSSR